MVVSIFSYTFLPPLAIESAHLLLRICFTDLLWCCSLFTSIGVWLANSLFELIHSIIEYLYRTLLQLFMLKTLWEFIQHNIRCRNCNFVLDRSIGIDKYWNKMVCLSECNPSFLIVSLHNSMLLYNTLTLVLIARLIFMHFHAHYTILYYITFYWLCEFARQLCKNTSTKQFGYKFDFHWCLIL